MIGVVSWGLVMAFRLGIIGGGRGAEVALDR